MVSYPMPNLSSSLRNRPPSALIASPPLSHSRGFRGLFQPRDTRLDIFKLNGLLGVIENAVGCTYPRRCRRVHIEHDLEERRRRCARRLLEPCDGLSEGLAACGAVGGTELWNSQPPQERFGSNAHHPCCFFSVSLGKQGRNGFFLLPPEFCTVPGHLGTNEDICPEVTCLFGPPE